MVRPGSGDRAALANLTHELYTPLHGVIGMTCLLLDSGLAPAQRELALAVQRSAEALLRVSGELLDYAAFGDGAGALRDQPFDLGTVLTDVATLLRDRAKDKGLMLVVRPLRLSLRGDGGRVRQVLHRLADNAIKFTEEGEVVLSAERGDSDGGVTAVRLSVADTGTGLPAAGNADTWFEPFAQADTATTRRHGGVGLGLANARQMIERMGGRIGVDARPGGGAVFWFELILPVVPEQPERDPRVPARDGLRVLVVDDNAAHRQVMGMLLQRSGHGCEAVADGEAALAWLVQQPVDAVLMDGRMPGLDGYETTRRIRSGAVAGIDPRIPIIGLAAYDTEAERHRGLAAGMTEVLARPVRIEELQAALERAALLLRIQTPAEEVPVLDLERIGHLSELQDEDSPGFVVQMIDLFLTESVLRSAKIRAGAAAGDLPAMADAAHALKGAAASIGAVALRNRCAIIEQLARAGDGAGAVQASDGLEEDQGRLATALELEKKRTTL